MCLGIPGVIVESLDHDDLVMVDVSGVRRAINIALLADAEPAIGDWVLIHVGFAIAKIDEEEARLALASLEMLGAEGEFGDVAELGGYFQPPEGWEARP